MTHALHRRELLAAIAATGAIAMSPASLARPRNVRFFREADRRHVGLQLYTLGEVPAKDIDATFAELAAIGYRDIELPQLYGKTPAELHAAAARAGLVLSSVHLALMPQMSGDALSLASPVQRIVDDLGAMRIHNAVMPIAPFPEMPKPGPGENFMAAIGRIFAEAGADYWKRTAATLNEKAAALKPFGITLGYHNHNVEFGPVAGGTTGWDILVAETDPSLVFFEVDVGWVASAGLDPVAFLGQYAGRLRWLHVKDLKASTKANFALTMDPTEVGTGEQDWARILPAAAAAGVQHFYVEQEPPFAIPRMEAVRRSYAYLSKLAVSAG